jgi:AraC-type DNA-binding domain-containing proteins
MYYSIDLLSDSSERVPYSNPAFPLYAGRGRISSFQNMAAASHWHDDIEFGIVLSGKMSYCINGEHLIINTGEGIFINSRQLHHNYSSDGSDCQYLCVLIHPSLFCENKFIRENFAMKIISNNSFNYTVLRNSTAWQGNLIQVVEAIFEAYTETEELSYFMLQSISYQIVSMLFQHMPKEEKRSLHIDRRFSSLRNMIGYIQAHYEERISLMQIAAAGKISESTCCNIFKHQLNQTPMYYLNRYRLEKSLGLMAQPELSITEIAYAVGFTGASYFAETFKKHFGLSPSEYRKVCS